MQLKVSPTIQFFDNMLRNKFSFSEYTSTDKPTLFFGVYRDKDIRVIESHNGIAIVWLAGSDSMIDEILQRIKDLQDKKGIIVVSESNWIANDLDRFEIKYEPISLFLDDIYKWNPVPHGESLFWYSAGTTKHGKDYLPAIRREFPSLDIITNDAHSVPRDKMHEVYARCFAGFRPIEHDGCSMSAAEMGLMGRYTIYNGDGHHALHYRDIEDVIRIIKELQGGYNYKLIAKRTREFFKENEKRWCDLVLGLCGSDEMDAAGVFSESSKKPASIFRIMRSSAVRQIPNLFGTAQFERPYMIEQLNKLGLKQIVTNKNSGFVAGEFKSVHNKGYKEDFKDFHTYDERY